MADPAAAAGTLALPAHPRLIRGMSEDRQLVARIRAGDSAAFEAVFRRYVVPLCAFAYRYVRSRDVAAEVVQDVFLAIWRQHDSWTVDTSLNAYLYRATRNRAVDVVRRDDVERRWAARWPADEPAASSLDLAHDAVDATDDAATLARAVERGLGALPARCREVFVLRWRNDMSYAAIAASMGTTVKTVENQMNRAIRAIRKAARP